jgi:toxin ParE1/3/4
MTARFVLTKVAETDLEAQARYIAEKAGCEPALRLYLAAEAAFELLAKTPELAVVRDFGRPELSGLRMWPICRFEKHLIFYRPTDQGIEVVRVLHASRDIEAILLGRP